MKRLIGALCYGLLVLMAVSAHAQMGQTPAPELKKLDFMAGDWKSDGTMDGTVLVKDISPGALGSNPSQLTNVNGTLFFTANDGSGRALWKSDGTAAGTLRVAGVGANDLLWYRAPWGREEAIRRVGKVPLKYPFRGGFQYQTTMFTTASGFSISITASRSASAICPKSCCPAIRRTEPDWAHETYGRI